MTPLEQAEHARALATREEVISRDLAAKVEALREALTGLDAIGESVGHVMTTTRLLGAQIDAFMAATAPVEDEPELAPGYEE